jgi:hypothetical protein
MFKERQLGRPRKRWKDIIIDLKKIGVGWNWLRGVPNGMILYLF